MAQVNQPANLIDQVIALRKEVAELRKRVGLGNATISGGTFTVQGDGIIQMIDADGNLILYFGPDDRGQQVIRINRDLGLPVMHTYPVSGGNQYWALFDRGGRIVASDDAVSGTGMARPWIPVCFERVRLPTDMPSVTDSSFVTVWEANFNKSHPQIELWTVDGCDGGTTGEGQIVITGPGGAGGVVDSWSTTSAFGRNYRGPYDLPGEPYSGQVRVSVQYRRVSGSGNVYSIAMDATQRQSP
jgi:hypothetical protein